MSVFHGTPGLVGMVPGLAYWGRAQATGPRTFPL